MLTLIPNLVEREGRPAPADLALQRSRIAGAFDSIADGRRSTIGHGSRRILCFGDPSADTLIIHFHGGGYRQGQPEMSAAYASRLAAAAQVEVWCPAYRLAPEEPFPAAINDASAILAHVQARKPHAVLLAGDSAGGGLAAALAQICTANGSAVSGLILHSPWLDLRVHSKSYHGNAQTDPLFSKTAARTAAEAYLQGHAATDPLASPILADATLFAPTFISVGSGEVLLDDALTFHERIQSAGGDVHLCQVEDMEHVAVTRGAHLTGSAVVFDETVRFVKNLNALALAWPPAPQPTKRA